MASRNFVQNIVNFSGIVDHAADAAAIIAVADDRVSNKRAGFASCRPQRACGCAV
jgi:hypothetical protein